MINGALLKDAVISAANNIVNNRQSVDELNVFPVPDGDTGTNMSMTISAAAAELKKTDGSLTVGEIAKINANALLRGARGNSGVILSLLFRGFSKGLKGVDEADGKAVAKAFSAGVEAAYKAVMKPTEGTILTVARVAAEEAEKAAKENDDAVYIFELITNVANKTLLQTPEMLPVLKKAGVVDAGGKGLCVILEGMLSVFKDGVIIADATEADGEQAEGEAAPSAKNAAAEWEGEITFTYCTEFIVKRENQNDPKVLRAYLESIGDCVVVVDDESIIKVHVHTDNPGNALQKGLEFGQLTKLKIENMREQHENAVKEAEEKVAAEAPKGPAPKTDKYGFVAVAAGEGLIELFKQLGAANVVSGGQTMNPSTDDILRAIEQTPAETVFVLPNNKNIIMAAEQAKPLATRKVHVLHTKTVPMGISAMVAYDESADVEENLMAMMKSAENVGTGQLTFAARDSEFDGKKIKEGELLALENGKLSFTDNDITHAAVKLCRQLTKKDSTFITVIYGEDVDDGEAENTFAAIEEKFPNIEFTLINGGQPVYYYIISVE